ncbi:hypothetical protein BH09VER1_BH09VER1_14680 [soil metagenome]
MEKSPNPINCDDESLTKFKIFADLSRDEVATLIAQSSISTHLAGERIIHVGETGHCMYVILKGSVHVTAPSENKQVDLATLYAGDFFGEVALVDDGPRSADVTALEDCELLSITRMTLGILAGLQPGAAIQILAAIGRSLVARVRAGNQKYMDLILLGRQIS